jgi:hypothetical protein
MLYWQVTLYILSALAAAILGAMALCAWRRRAVAFLPLDIVPAARSAVIEEMSDGVIVLDVQDCVVDINPGGWPAGGARFERLA